MLVGGGLILTAAVAAIWLVWRDRLPDPVATHWGTDMQPDGNMTFWVIFGVAVGTTAVALLGLVIAGRTRPGPQQAMVATTCYFVMGILLGVTISTVSANLDAAVWDAARPIGGIDIVLVLACGLGVGAVGLMLAGGWSALVFRTPSGTRPTVNLAPGSAAMWTGSAGSWALVGLGIVLLAAAVVIGLVAGLFAAVVMMLSFVLVVWFAALRVTVTSRGVTVGVGWLAWPRIRIPIGEIEAAEFLDVDPMAFGGWGYRITPGVRGFIIRRGEGFRLVRSDKADIVVTVDDAERGAGLVNDLIARSDDTSEVT